MVANRRTAAPVTAAGRQRLRGLRDQRTGRDGRRFERTARGQRRALDVVGRAAGPGDSVGSAEDGRARRAIRWRGGASAEELGALPGHVTSEAVAINTRGEVAGWSGPLGGERAALWAPGLAVRDLGTLPGGQWSRARAVNGHGEVVGSSGSFLGARAFRWTAAAGLQDLNDLVPISDFVLLDVAGVNEAGEILVIGRDELPDAGADTHTNHEFPVRVFFLQPLP